MGTEEARSGSALCRFPRIMRALTIVPALVCWTLTAACLLGCETPREPGPVVGGGQKGRLVVVATIPPLADLARRVGGERVDVVTLVPPGASEHAWEPSPRDAMRLQAADVFFRVGFGFETWASKLVEAGGGDHLTVDASETVEPIAAADDGPARPLGKGGDAAASRAGDIVANPHTWLDPVAMEGAVARLAEALAKRDPDGGAEYRSRATATADELRALDAEIRARTAAFSSRVFVSYHSAWDYFARRYGLEVAGSIEESPGREASPRHIAKIVALVKSRKIRAVFAEPQFPPKVAEAVADECGVPVLTLDPLGGPGAAGREDYLALMRYNVGVMEQVLR